MPAFLLQLHPSETLFSHSLSTCHFCAAGTSEQTQYVCHLTAWAISDPPTPPTPQPHCPFDFQRITSRPVYKLQFDFNKLNSKPSHSSGIIISQHTELRHCSCPVITQSLNKDPKSICSGKDSHLAPESLLPTEPLLVEKASSTKT